MFPILDNGPVNCLLARQPGDDLMIHYDARGACACASGFTSFHADLHVRRNFAGCRAVPSSQFDQQWGLSAAGSRGKGVADAYWRAPGAQAERPRCIGCDRRFQPADPVDVPPRARIRVGSRPRRFWKARDAGRPRPEHGEPKDGLGPAEGQTRIVPGVRIRL